MRFHNFFISSFEISFLLHLTFLHFMGGIPFLWMDSNYYMQEICRNPIGFIFCDWFLVNNKKNNTWISCLIFVKDFYIHFYLQNEYLVYEYFRYKMIVVLSGWKLIFFLIERLIWILLMTDKLCWLFITKYI